MLEFLHTCENCFFRECQVGHFTASAFLLNQKKDKTLLMHHTKLDKWLQLGGHCDGDHNVLQVAIKEAQEESGIHTIKALSKQIFDIDIHLIPQFKSIPAHYHFDVRFLLYSEKDEPVVSNKESKELKWFSKDISELPTKNPSIMRMFNKWNKVSLSQ